MQVRDLGRMPYGPCLELQRQLHREVSQGRSEDVVLLVEHPPVATLGRRGTRADVFDADLEVFEIERGGKATYHGLGQLVVYPIVHLGVGNRDIRAWVRHIEGFAKRLLAEWGIASHTKLDRPGVWTDATNRKIASIGIAVRDWVSLHGLALNVDLDPREFERLDPCGLGASVMTNMVREGADVDLEAARAWAVRHAVDHFSDFGLGTKKPSSPQTHYY